MVNRKGTKVPYCGSLWGADGDLGARWKEKKTLTGS